MKILIKEITTDREGFQYCLNEGVKLCGWKIISVQQYYKHWWSLTPTWIMTCWEADATEWCNANGEIEKIIKKD